MLNENFLLDSFEETGNDLNDFEKLSAEIAGKTKFYRTSTRELTLLSYICDGKKDPDMMYFYYVSPDRTQSETVNDEVDKAKAWRESFCQFKKSSTMRKGDFSKLVDELTSKSKVLLYNGARCLYISHEVITSRLQQFGLSGSFLEKPCIERDKIIAKAFSEGKKKTFVIREFNNVNKVFSILGDRYKDLPQNILMDIYKQIFASGMGTVECRKWSIGHFISRIHLEFPEKAEEFQTIYGLDKKLIPGVLLETSDTGNSSLRIQGTWRIGNALTVHDEVTRKHIGDIDIPQLLKNVEETIFDEYTKLPEALVDLMAQDITDPTWDLSTISGLAKNQTAIENVLQNAFNSLQIVKAIGHKSKKQLFEQMLAEFDPHDHYTAYDFAINFLGVCERLIDPPKTTLEKLQAAVARAPYIHYHTTKKAEIVLGA